VITSSGVEQAGFLLKACPSGTAHGLSPNKPADASPCEGLGAVRIRHRDDATPGLDWIIDQLEYFWPSSAWPR
jgi:hypothetical protein